MVANINVLEKFLNIVDKYPQKIAVKDDFQTLTFSQLNTYALMLSTGIIKTLGYDTAKPICVYLDKSCNALICFLAILYSGNIYVPLDVDSPQERTSKIYRNIEPLLTITNRPTLEKNAFIQDLSKILLMDSPESKVDEDFLTNYQDTISLSPAYIINTSGSTGIPKGVVISHGAILDYISWAMEEYHVDETHRITSQAPFYFDNSVLDIYLCLFTGAILLIPSLEVLKFPQSLLKYMIEHQSNHIFWVPSMLTMFYKFQALDGALPPLKNILFAGEVMPLKTLKYWQERFPHAVFSNLYGPTEITVDAMFYTITQDVNNLPMIPIGKACKNTKVLLLNECNEVIKEPHKTGELCIKGVGLSLGYYKDKQKTDEVFCQTPEHNNYRDLIYKTGDLGYYDDDNNIIFVGRKDFQIKHMGYRIDLGEIESAIFTMDEITNCMVIYHDDKIQMIYESSHEIKKGLFNKKLAKILPRYMLPSIYSKVDEIKLTSNGKADRKFYLQNNNKD